MHWLPRLLLVSFGFNVLAFALTIAVTFGIQIGKWIDQVRKTNGRGAKTARKPHLPTRVYSRVKKAAS